MTCAKAAEGGHLKALIYAWGHGCPWQEFAGQEWFLDVMHTSALAAGGGHLAVVIWLREHGRPFNEWTCAMAAEGGHLEVLQWAREHDCPWDDGDNHQLECLCERRSGRAPGGVEVASGAPLPEGGHLELMQRAVEHCAA